MKTLSFLSLHIRNSRQLSRIIILIIISYLIISFPSPVFGEEATKGTEKKTVVIFQTMKDLDVDGDQIVTEENIIQYSEKAFILMDVNQNSVVNIKEFKQFVCIKTCETDNCECDFSLDDNEYITKSFAAIDRNRNTRFTLGEWTRTNLGILKREDHNKDGQLDVDDLSTESIDN